MKRETDDSQTIKGGAGAPSSYRVEVSGWDARENFFVEKTSLDWKEREGKTVALRAAVRLDSVLFVRLLRPLGGGADFPVPHRAVRIEGRDGNVSGGVPSQVALEQLQPRRALRESVAEAIVSVIRAS